MRIFLKLLPLSPSTWHTPCARNGHGQRAAATARPVRERISSKAVAVFKGERGNDRRKEKGTPELKGVSLGLAFSNLGCGAAAAAPFDVIQLEIIATIMSNPNRNLGQRLRFRIFRYKTFSSAVESE